MGRWRSFFFGGNAAVVGVVDGGGSGGGWRRFECVVIKSLLSRCSAAAPVVSSPSAARPSIVGQPPLESRFFWYLVCRFSLTSAASPVRGRDARLGGADSSMAAAFRQKASRIRGEITKADTAAISSSLCFFSAVDSVNFAAGASADSPLPSVGCRRPRRSRGKLFLARIRVRYMNYVI